MIIEFRWFFADTVRYYSRLQKACRFFVLRMSHFFLTAFWSHQSSKNDFCYLSLSRQKNDYINVVNDWNDEFIAYMCNSLSKISHSARFLQFSISIHRKMKLRFFRKKRSNIDSSVIAKEFLKTRIKLTVKSFENISSTIIFAILSSSQNSLQNSSQKSVKKSIKKSIKKSVKFVLFFSIKQSIKQSIKSIKKSIRKAFISSSNVNYFAFLKISNDDEIDDDLLIDDKVKKLIE
jgi:hypothetical protein